MDSELDVQWNVTFTGYPRPTLIWFNNNCAEISKLNKPQKYAVETLGNMTTLTVHQLQLNDTGTYTLRAYNQLEKVDQKLHLFVRSEFWYIHPSILSAPESIDQIWIHHNVSDNLFQN